MITCSYCGQSNNLGQPCKYCGAPIPLKTHQEDIEDIRRSIKNFMNESRDFKSMELGKNHGGPYLNIRCGPGMGYNVVGILNRNDRVEVQKQVDGWAKIGDGRWASMVYLKRFGIVT